MAMCIVIGASASNAQQMRSVSLTTTDVNRLADSAFADYVRETAEPSLAVVVVRGDSVLFAKGYGYESGTMPVSPESTLFHIASLTKLFVATAVMQLVEQGRMRLDDSIGKLLSDPRIPRGVTLRQLLTHTSGLDAPFLADVVDRQEDLRPLSTYFAQHAPRLGRPPAREIRYSNYGMALAALIVEKVSGEPFDSYLERHVLGPLAMSHSSLRQPPPQTLERRIAIAGSRPVPNYLLIYPAGAMVSTPSDLGRFMRFHLRDGGSSDSTVLATRSLVEMRRRQWSAHPKIPGVALGFFESDMGGARALFHTGARTHFSLIYLLPEEGVGVFIVHSMRQGGPFQSLRTNFVRAFVRRYFPRNEGLEHPGGSAITSRTFEGVYRPVLFSNTSIERAALLFADTRVVANADGSLDVRIPASRPLNVVSQTSGLFRVQEGDHEGVAIAFNDTTRVPTRMFLSGATQDPVTFDRLRWFERGFLHLIILAVAFVVLGSYSVVTAGSAVWRKLTKRPVKEVRSESLIAQWPALISSVFLLVAPIVAMAVLASSDASEAPKRAIGVGVTLLFGASILALATVPISVLAWRRDYWTRWRRVYHAIFAACAVAFFALAAHYHLGPFWL